MVVHQTPCPGCNISSSPGCVRVYACVCACVWSCSCSGDLVTEQDIVSSNIGRQAPALDVQPPHTAGQRVHHQKHPRRVSGADTTGHAQRRACVHRRHLPAEQVGGLRPILLAEVQHAPGRPQHCAAGADQGSSRTTPVLVPHCSRARHCADCPALLRRRSVQARYIDISTKRCSSHRYLLTARSTRFTSTPDYEGPLLPKVFALKLMI
jgi:hypothetical protein